MSKATTEYEQAPSHDLLPNTARLAFLAALVEGEDQVTVFFQDGRLSGRLEWRDVEGRTLAVTTWDGSYRLFGEEEVYQWRASPLKTTSWLFELYVEVTS